jgi:hypothetical protein
MPKWPEIELSSPIPPPIVPFVQRHQSTIPSALLLQSVGKKGNEKVKIKKEIFFQKKLATPQNLW